MKSVLIVASNGMGNSGVPNVISQVVKSQMDKVHFVVVVFNDDDFYYPLLKEAGAKIIKVNTLTPKNPVSKLIYHCFSKAKQFHREAIEIIKSESIDIIHCFKEEESWPFLKAAKQLGIHQRIVHCNTEFKYREKFFPRKISILNRRKMLKYGTTFVGGSIKCCDSLFMNHKYEVIHYTYNESKFNSSVKNELDNELVLTQIATYSSNKNQLFSIEVANALKNSGHDCKLNLIGFPNEDGFFEKMKSLIKKFNLEENVSLIDGRNGSGDVLKHTTFFLLPSLSEGAPLTLIEAQACGITCFASDQITREVDCGGVIYLPINQGAEVWKNSIIDVFKKQKNTRKTYDLSEFSAKTFSNKISKLYE